MNSSFNSLIELLLPEYLTHYFELTSIDRQQDALHLYLEELNKIPLEYSTDKLQSKGFFESITVQDFPIREYKVYLHIKRRRWLNLSTNKVVFRDWNLVAKGTRLTQEFASFLKEINRY
ncbi:ISAon1 family transposase N-terminal region protein [Flavobacterium oreochromis]|uniref:Transposase n=2 Tax=Flavobacterium TaxID=237 RepID=A0A246G8Y6_9FLAO|nr:transposase [Flavobacterium oreochromis]OWP73967.1 transposase [Flavobacterium oreochromis]